MELDSKKFSIRSLSPDDWREFRMMRLMALKMHPQFFLGVYDKAAQEPERFWREALSYKRECIFGLYDGYHIIGITGVFPHRQDESGKTAHLGMSFIEPAYRKLGLSRLLYQARIDWARENAFEKITVGHREGNEASKAANQKFGFVYTHVYEREWPDGTKAMDVNYELKL